MLSTSEFGQVMVSNYGGSLYALTALLVMVFVQSLVTMIAHRKQSQYIPGIVGAELGQESFVFRSNRTFLNSLENLPLMVFPALIAMLVGMDATWLSGLLWVYVIARLVHMVLYYVIATEANPSPRSYFFAIGLLCNLILFIVLGMHLVG